MPRTTHRNGSRPMAECQEIIDYEFTDLTLLQEALTHASGADRRVASNERLEFLGDAILGAIVCEMLFRQFPDYLEGDLTKIKSVVVSRRTCTKISEELGIDQFLLIGKGMGSRADTPPSVLADVFESLIGAIYLDGGIEAARRFVARHLGPEIEAAVEGQNGLNHKSNLQQLAQRDYGETPTYLLLDEKGPDHSKCFKIAARIGERRYAPAWGRNKKEAEQRAALNALCQLGGESLPFHSD
jgi:ribonuclease-3